MTWVDGVLFGLMAVTAYGGYVRGVVQELFDLLVVGIGAAVALRYFGDVAEWLQRLTGMQSTSSYWAGFLTIFIPVAAIILSLGLRLDQMSEDDQSIPPIVKSAFGGILGAIKGIFLAWTVVVALHYMPFVDAGMRADLKHAPIVQGVQGLSPTFLGFIGSVTPTEVSKWLIPAVDRQF